MTDEIRSDMEYLKQRGDGWEHIAKALNYKYALSLSPIAWRKRWSRLHKEEKTIEVPHVREVIETNSKGTTSERVIGLDRSDLMDEKKVLLAHGFDPCIWKVISARHSEWEAVTGKEQTRTLYASKVTVAKRTEESIDSIIESFSSLEPRALPKTEKQEGNRMLELSLSDIHLGRLSWAGTAGESYDIQIAIDRVRKVVSGIVERMGTEVYDTIIVPCGGDLLNSDSSKGETTNGTPQDMDGRYPKLISKTLDMMVSIVEEMRKHTREVKVTLIPGNHDEGGSFVIALGLKAWFRNCEDVKVDTNAVKRKYIVWKDCLLCVGHFAEDGKQLSYILPMEAKEQWSKAKFVEAHGGHTHRETVQDCNSFILRRSPTLASADEWSSGKGYVTRARHATYIWREGCGMEEMWIHNA